MEDKEIMRIMANQHREERKRIIRAVWEAHAKTINKPYNEMTEAEHLIANLFYTFVRRIDTEKGEVYYTTDYETFSTAFTDSREET